MAIQAVDLRKRYGAVTALDGLTLGVPNGSICGLLGTNGAGKTTTLKILLGMAHPDSGRARILGMDIDGGAAGVAARSRTGFVSENKDLDDRVTVDDIIRFTAACYPAWRSDLAARYQKTFELPPDRIVKALSRGKRTMLALLLALCRGAELLILDEPTSGLDPVGIEAALQLLVSHVAREGTTVLFSSHQIPEVEQIADRIAIVARGRVVVEGDLEELQQRYRRVQLVFDSEAPAANLRAHGIVRVRREGRTLSVLTSGGEGPVLDETRGWAPVAVDVLPITLKELFLETLAGGES